MCGIYGQIEKFSEAQLAFLDRQLFHRGPDERRWKEFSHIHLFHARLSIVDAPGGAQPMETERYAIIFNGEIYNHLELRSRFGLLTKTRSDTETLLLLYEKLGVDMLSYLDGMFSFAIYDKQTKEVVLCRDRMGEKPLYYLRDEKRFCFASELNTLTGLRQLNIRPEAQVQFLVCGWVGPEKTIYENVFHVLPGHYVRVSQDPTGRITFKSRCWWSYSNLLLHTPKKSNENALTEELLELLKVSVKRRVESSDLPVGCFLSGGLDSSIVTTMASFIKAPLPTYTFIFDEEYNEGPIAAQLSKIVQTRHEEIHVNYDHICDDIGNILLAYGEPFCDDSAIPSYYIAREAKKLNTVIINGDGGDELFGGYRRYVPLAWPTTVQRIIKGISKGVFPFLPAPKKKIDGYNYIYRLAQLSNLSYPEKYLSLTTNLFKSSESYASANKAYVPQAKQWISDHFEQGYKIKGSSFSQSDTGEMSKKGHSLSEMRQCMLADIQSLLPVVLLKKVDISTMQSSLESRTVFFTPEILQFAASLPDRLLISGTTTKVLLRKFAKKYLPADIFRLPKRGFELPLIHFMNGKLKEIVQDYLMSENAIIHSIIPRAEVESIFYRKEPISEDRRSKMLYTLFVLEYWMKNKLI